MLAHETAGECQPESRSPFLGGRAWLEEVGADCLGNAAAAVAHLHARAAARSGSELEFDARAGGTCLERVLDQVDEHLLYFARVASYGHWARGVHYQRNVLGLRDA